jgi:hypothetical protein
MNERTYNEQKQWVQSTDRLTACSQSLCYVYWSTLLRTGACDSGLLR